MKTKSIVLKLFFIMAIVAVSLTLIVSYFINLRVQEDLSGHMNDEVDIITEALNFAFSPLIEANDGQAIQEAIDVFVKYEVIKGIRIHDTTGKILYSSNLSEVGESRPSALISLAVDDPTGGRQSIQFDDSILMSAIPLVCGHGDTLHSDADAILCVAMDFRYQSSIAKTVGNDLSISFVVLTTVFLAIVWVFMQRLLGKPLHKLVEAADEISKNNYEHRIEIDERSELQDLALAFNKMTENVKENSSRLEKAKESAEKASEVRLEFLAKMSHEIRTPLNAIIGFSDILSEELDSPNQKEAMDIVVSSGKHLLNLVNEILDISKIDSDQMLLESQPFSIRSLIGDIANMFALATNEKRCPVEL